MPTVFTCCCVNDHPTVCLSSGNVQHITVGDGKDAMREVIHEEHLGELMQSSADGRFPNLQYQRSEGPSEDCVKASSSTSRASPSMTPRTPLQEEKDQEKARLQSLVNDFKRNALQGIVVDLVDPESLQVSQHVLSVDRLLIKLSLQEVRPGESTSVAAAMSMRSLSSLSSTTSSQDGSVQKEGVRSFDMKDLRHIYKDAREIPDRAPKLGDTSPIVGIQVASLSIPEQYVFFCFASEQERDKFYTCLKILHTSAIILRSKAVASKPLDQSEDTSKAASTYS